MKYRQFALKYLDIRIDGGEEVYALCPFHDDSKPSFAFNVKKGLWVCYGCGEAGNFRKLVKRMGDPNVPGPTLDDLRRSLGTRKMPEQHHYPEAWLDQFDSAVSPKVRNQIASRWNVTDDTQRKFRIGWDGSARAITIPLHDQHGRLLGVNRRMTRGEVKYKYPRGFKRSDNLYAYHRIPMGVDLVAVTEGCFDSLALWAIGVPSVAIYGSSMSEHQERMLASLVPRRVVIATDKDEAGVKAGQQVKSLCDRYHIPTTRLSYGDNATDPCEFPSPDALETSLWIDLNPT